MPHPNRRPIQPAEARRETTGYDIPSIADTRQTTFRDRPRGERRVVFVLSNGRGGPRGQDSERAETQLTDIVCVKKQYARGGGRFPEGFPDRLRGERRVVFILSNCGGGEGDGDGEGQERVWCEGYRRS